MNQGSSTPVVVVSNDTHIGPRLVEDLRPYCPQQHLDEFDRYYGASFASPFEVEHPEDRDEPSVTRLALRHTFCDISPEDTLRMVGQNAIDIYGLDADALQAVANEIGAPTLDELGSPIDAIPQAAANLLLPSVNPA